MELQQRLTDAQKEAHENSVQIDQFQEQHDALKLEEIEQVTISIAFFTC